MARREFEARVAVLEREKLRPLDAIRDLEVRAESVTRPVEWATRNEYGFVGIVSSIAGPAGDAEKSFQLKPVPLAETGEAR